MKKLTSILLICLMALCFVGNNITFVHASPYSSAKFDIKDGNGKQQVIPAEFDFNPTTYVWDETIVSVCPISSANTVHFVGWSKEMNGLNNDGELSLVPMGNGTSYTPSDFDLSNGSITYYAIWANEYDKLVLFFDYTEWVEPLDDNDANWNLYGFTYEASTHTLTIDNMTVAYIYRRIDKADGGSLFCFVNEDNDYTVNITGTNNIGSPIAFEDMIEETMYTPTCLYNFISSKGNISVKGNGSLTIYDYESGIKSFKSIDFTKDFTGKITIYDSGKTIEVELNCCLIAKEDIIIRNGTFRLYNDSSSCISAKNIYLLTDDIICSSNTKAINAKDQLVIKQNGAFNAFESINDKGSKLTTTLDNQTLSGYSLVNDYESAKYISLKRQTVGTSVDTCLGKFIALITVTLSMVYVARKKH